MLDIMTIENTGQKPRRKPDALRAMAIYGLSVMLLKGFSLFTIPLYARYLDPQEYGRLEVAVSVIEFVGLCAALGLADTLYRFAGSGDLASRRAAEREVFGAGFLGAALLLVAGQALAPVIHGAFDMDIGITPLRAGLFAATITGLVEMPLAWMRLNERAYTYLSFVTSRTIIQISMTWYLLANGFGAASILYATGALNLLSASVFVVLAARSGGLRLSRVGLVNLVHYGLPLVGGGLAMYALGTFDRLFLVHTVPVEYIGHYAIAAKLALATSLFIQPLALWWNPRRMAVLDQPDGKVRHAEMWSVGFVILLVGAVSVTLIMPVFIRFGLPPAYEGALVYLPWLVLASVLNELAGLSNAGSYKRANGFELLGVNVLAATVAVSGYLFLIPQFGIAGAIAATLVAHCLRVGLFIMRGRECAPVALISASALIVSLTALNCVLLGQSVQSPAAQASMLLGAPVVIVLVAICSGLVPRPDFHRYAMRLVKP